MEQVRALNALEPFLALTKSATSPRAAADLITRATSAPNTYVFAELLDCPQIQAIANSDEHAAYLRILEIFSHGTYADYISTPNLPALNEQQTLKLRQLSLLSLAKAPHNLTYASLQRYLGLADIRAVEDLVISAIYAELVEAQLDPRSQIVNISSVSPLRDLAPNSVPLMLNSLQAWSARCTSTLENLENQIASIKAEAAHRQAEKQARLVRHEMLVEAERAAMENNKLHNSGRGGGVHGHETGGLLNRAISNFRGGGRYGKRGSGSLDGLNDEAMEIDDPSYQDEVDEEGSNVCKKKATRRKL